MSEVAYCATLGVALVFAWAGLAKLRQPKRVRRSFAALGVPAGLARVVPVIELLLAGALVVVPPVGLVAAALLVAFTLVLVRADDGVGCACFGGASTESASSVAVVRNVALVAAALAGATSSPTVPGVAALLAAAGVAALVALAVALVDLGRRTGAILRVDLP